MVWMTPGWMTLGLGLDDLTPGLDDPPVLDEVSRRRRRGGGGVVVAVAGAARIQKN